ncbi:hypothetical protein BKA58DRAFT_168783 [Alternaria rosae]|uniref:uncharacterized protein n=1 Tax=Alternaria rosae TaxID=1187941 RepID=UPI001E8E272C|nr:uncharacterized protein BKA58DRAFT_168783 [Alternaria rosae]KAH6869979.1 hypothetical protein BKA58DRAFT_168783 [Alternaria rosae]
MVCYPATNWLRRRVLLHSVHLASKALAKARLISTRVIAIEDNQRFHSCVAQAWSSEHVTGQAGLQYVMAAGRRLMRMRPDPALWLRSLHDLHSNSTGAVQDRRLHVEDRSDTKSLRAYPFVSNFRWSDGFQQACYFPTAPAQRLPPPVRSGASMVRRRIFLFPSAPPPPKKQGKLSHVLHFFLSCMCPLLIVFARSALHPAGADSLC